MIALRRGQRRQRFAHVRQGGVGEHHPLGELARQRHHALAQRRDDDRRQGTERLLGAELLDEGARVGQWLAWRHAHPDMRRPVRDADAQPEPSARDLMHHCRTLREIDDGALIDRRDRGAERDRLGVPRQRLAHRHVAERARHVDAGEAAPFGLLRQFDGAASAPGHGDQAQGGKRFGHRDGSFG